MRRFLLLLVLLAAPALGQGVSTSASSFPDSNAGIAGGYPEGWAQHTTLSTGLVAYWPLSETAGLRKDIYGGYDLHALQGNALSTVAGAGAGNGTRFTQTHTAVADIEVTAGAVGTGLCTVTSASAALPVFNAGDSFVLVAAPNSTMVTATAQGTATSVSVLRDGGGTSGYECVTAGPQAGSVRIPNWLVRGSSTQAGFGGFFPFALSNENGQINLNGTLGITVAMWLRIPTGAPTNKTYFLDGSAAFGAAVSLGDSNAGQLAVNCNFTDVGAANPASAPGSAPALDTWYFFVCYFDPVTRTATMNRNNGAATATGAAMGGTGFPNIGTEFGGGRVEIGGVYRPLLFGGVDIGAVGLWNRLLAPAEITFLYNAGAGRKY